MLPFVTAIATAILLQPSLAAHCQSGSCVEDETSLLQVENIVKSAAQRVEAPRKLEAEAALEAEEGDAKPKKHHAKAKKAAQQAYMAAVLPAQYAAPAAMPQQPAVQLGSVAAASTQQQLPTSIAATFNAAATGEPMASQPWGVNANVYQAPFVSGYSAGFVPNPTDYHQFTMNVQTQVSPGGGNDDPKKSAARAAQAEEAAERAMEDAVWKAQQEERASMFASKRAAALRAAAEKATSSQTQAARAQIEAADAMESDAVRKASTGRNHARLAAYKAVVQQATAYQAAADQTFASQRAVAARSAMQMAQNGLHNMQDDSTANDKLFNDRDASRSTRHRYHDAMDNINYDRQRFHEGDPPEEYDTDEDPGYDYGYGGGGVNLASGGSHSVSESKLASCKGFACSAPTTLLPHAGNLLCGIEGCTANRCCSAAAGVATSTGSDTCRVGDLVDATFSGDGRQYRAKVAAFNADSTVSVDWLDGYQEGNVVPGAQVFNNGQPCNSR